MRNYDLLDDDNKNKTNNTNLYRIRPLKQYALFASISTCTGYCG